MKLFKALLLLGLVVAALAQDTTAPPDVTEEGVRPSRQPGRGKFGGGRRGNKKADNKLNCTNVECDQAVLTECEQPVLFLGDSCCPVCPMTDVCAEVECGEGEVCSEKDGEPVCCTDTAAEHKGKKDLNKRLRNRFGFEKCSTRKELRTGVNRGPCKNSSCDEDEVCMAVLRRAFCCPRPDADLPPCEGAAAVETTFLARCHAPDVDLPTKARSNGNCRCRVHRRGRRPNRPRPTKASTEEEEEEEEEPTEAELTEEPTQVSSTEETESSEGGQRRGGRQRGGRKRGGRQPEGDNEENRDGRRGNGRRQGKGGRPSGRGFPRKRPTPRRLRCRCGYSIVDRLRQALKKAMQHIKQCRPAPRD